MIAPQIAIRIDDRISLHRQHRMTNTPRVAGNIPHRSDLNIHKEQICHLLLESATRVRSAPSPDPARLQRIQVAARICVGMHVYHDGGDVGKHWPSPSDVLPMGWGVLGKTEAVT